MKIFVFAFMILSPFNIFTQSWVVQNSGTTLTINDIYFVNSNIGFASCNGGVLLKTTNGGNVWFNVPGPYASQSITNARFFDQNTGLVFADSTYKTTNGGLSWHEVYARGLISCYIADSVTLYGCDAFWLEKTTNKGDSWTQTAYTPPFTTTSSFFNNALTGWVTTRQPQGFPIPTNQWVFIGETTDGGASWTTVYSEYSVLNANTMYSISFPSFDTGFVIGKSGNSVYRTINGGINWSETPIGSHFNCLCFVNAKTGWACTSDGYVYKTNSTGNNWFSNATPINSTLNSIFFVDSLIGWAAGNIGTIIKTTIGGVTFVSQISTSSPYKFYILQNYPNPFNPSTKIKFDVPKSSNAKLVIYDVLGREVATLVNEQLKPGSYEVEWDGSNYASGIYFLQLITEQYTQTRKMMLIK